MLVNLCFSLIIFLSNGDALVKEVTIIGEAQNAKYGAVVISEKTRIVYYLDGVEAWEPRLVGRLVSVTGKLKRKRFPTPKKGEEVSAGITGRIRILLNPKTNIVIRDPSF